MAFSPDGRLFVCQQTGSLRVIKNGSLLATPFVTLTVDSAGERGLLGVTFHPDFVSNPYVYVYYTVTSSPRHNRVSRFFASGDVALAGSETVILELNDLSGATNHNGGALHFGADGKLYIAAGENADSANSQTLANLLGKILRLNPDGTIPLDNPFYNTASGGNRAIWALGLRNPFTFDFQPGAGRMFINDVGQSSWEEINDGVAGSNYGWPATEGYTSTPGYRSPLHAYGHDSGCAITGGTFYNPTTPQFPSAYTGKYFFSDFCSGWIRQYDPASNTATGFATGISSPVDLKVGPDGNLYYLARGAGAVYRIFSASQAPRITTHPASQTVPVGQPATFSVTASGSSPLSYQWQRNGSDLPGATAASYTLASPTLVDSGAQFRCAVTNPYGSATSNSATLTVTTNTPPTATIVTPAAGTLYTAGQPVAYSGTGVDAQDGNLGAAAFTWLVDFHHDTHTHPAVQPYSGPTGGSFTPPTVGETSANVWYRIHLTVRDAGGLTASTYRDVLPRKATIRLASSPTGLRLTLEGQPVTAPYAVQSLTGMIRTLGAVSPQTLNGVTYEFVSWSDRGAATHNIFSPASDTIYAAAFRALTTGLAATYFNNKDLTGTSVSRIDSTVNFSFGIAAPAPGIGPDTYSVRWTGFIQPYSGQTYTFYTQSNDGVRLWVDGRLLINNWTDHSFTENSGQVTLEASRRYSIRLEYYNNTGNGTIKLLWSSPAFPKQIISTSRLAPQ